MRFALLACLLLTCAHADEEPTFNGHERGYYVSRLLSLGELDDGYARQELRRELAFALGQLGSASNPRLVELLAHPQAPVRQGACEALAQLRQDEAATTALLAVARADAARDVRLAAIAALGEGDVGSERVVPALLQRLDAVADGLERVELVAALAARAWGSEAARNALFDVWPGLSGNARPAAYEGLANSGPLAAPRLIRMLASDDVVVQVEAARALQAQALRWPDVIEPARALLERHPNPDVRAGAGEGDAELDDEPDAQPLPTDAALAVRLAAARKGSAEERAIALGDLARELGRLSATQRDRVAQAANEGLDDPEPGVRSSAADLAGALGLRKCLPALVRLAAEGDLDVRQHAIGALAALPGPEALEAVRSALRDPAPAIRRAALSGVVVWGADAAPLVPTLAELDDPGLLFETVQALGAIGPPAAPAIAPLQALATEADLLGAGYERAQRADLRRDAVAALGRIRAEEARGALLVALDSEHGQVRDEAREALKALTIGPKLVAAVERACADVGRALEGRRDLKDE